MTSEIRSYRDLRVWQEAMSLAEAAYILTADFPRSELYGLTSQMRRSAVSVPYNIAEGYGRDQTGAYVNFLSISRGSLKELETQLFIAERVKCCELGAIDHLLQKSEKLGKMLNALIKALVTKRIG